MHALGRPVLVGTASVAESERLSALVAAAGIPHRVLNARQDAEEARIVAGAGQRGAVTISTNMAGRGTDIVLGEGVAALGGLHVIGTNRHESRRIDHQLRGRAGRQGDPGSSQFFVSLEDDLLVALRHRRLEPGCGGGGDRAARGGRAEFRDPANAVEVRRPAGESAPGLFTRGAARCCWTARSRRLLLALDELWADHLAGVKELREGIHWRSWGGREPFYEFVRDAEEMFRICWRGWSD